MQPDRIVYLAHEIDRLSKALRWLQEHGNALSHRDKETFSVSIHINSCSALAGAREAEIQLSAIARLQIREIIAMAISDATNTIEIHCATLATEVAAPSAAIVEDGQ